MARKVRIVSTDAAMAPKVRIVSTVNTETNVPLPRVVKTTIKSSAARLCFRTRCLKSIRLRLGDLLFFHVASYAPASCHLGFAEGEEDCMVKIYRQCVHERHWLASHVDRPYARPKVSHRALAEAIRPRRRIKAPLDADGVYALSALCDLTCDLTRPSPTRVNISGNEDEEVELLDSDSDCAYLGEPEFPKTPLASALEIEDKAILRLLLRRRADPNGYQWHVYYEQEVMESSVRLSPLHLGVLLHRPDFVDMLLRSRADPDEWGEEVAHEGTPTGPDICYQFEREKPLWRVVSDTCRYNPISQQGMAARVMLQSLLCHGARASGIGKYEYDREYDDGRRRHTSPLDLAFAYSARERKTGAEPWANDAVRMLLSPTMSEKPRRLESATKQLVNIQDCD